MFGFEEIKSEYFGIALFTSNITDGFTYAHITTPEPTYPLKVKLLMFKIILTKNFQWLLSMLRKRMTAL